MAYTNASNSKLYFDSKLYTGNNSTNNITGLQFQPDWVYMASTSNGNNHHWYDAVRGVQQRLVPNEAYVQSTQTNAVSSFNSDGFTLGNNGDINTNSASFISWNWKANGAGSSNSDGSITSTVSASTNSGFSIVKWTGSGGNATIGHGLGAVPKMIIVKSLANTTSFMVYHTAIGNNSEKAWNTNAVAAGSSTAWQDTDPTNQVFYVAGGAGDGVNASGDYVAYVFADAQGFSKFGGFVGNGEPHPNSPFIYTGFRPAWVVVKSTTYAGQHWSITDDKRLGYNGSSAWFKADPGGAQLTNLVNPDLLSNGFKLGNNNDIYNKNGQSYLYMAFASAPLVGSNNVPSNAR